MGGINNIKVEKPKGLIKSCHTYLNNELTNFQIPWDISDLEIRGVNAFRLSDGGLRKSVIPGYLGC